MRCRCDVLDWILDAQSVNARTVHNNGNKNVYTDGNGRKNINWIKRRDFTSIIIYSGHGIWDTCGGNVEKSRLVANRLRGVGQMSPFPFYTRVSIYSISRRSGWPTSRYTLSRGKKIKKRKTYDAFYYNTIILTLTNTTLF